MSPWVDVPREGGESLAKQPLVTLRQTSVAFNSPFVKQADLKQHRFVSFKVDPETFRVGMRFHDDANDPTALTLTHDGGGGSHKRRQRNNLSVMAAALMSRNKWVRAVAKQKDVTLRRFQPDWNSLDKLWVITLRPSFERHAEQVSDIPSDACGIYRYVQDGQIVYIGKGSIRGRAQSPERDDWKWETIEYSVISDEPQQFKWETWWLEWFERRHNTLPQYNRIGGQRL